MNRPNTVTELMAEAAKALISRDTLRIEELQRISRDWMQTSDEAESQRLLLYAILEAACLLEGEPSEIPVPTDDREYDWTTG